MPSEGILATQAWRWQAIASFDTPRDESGCPAAGSNYTRVGAAMTLGHLGEAAEAAIPRLEILARKDPSRKVRETAATAIRRIRKGREG
jgi:hypothetical protein